MKQHIFQTDAGGIYYRNTISAFLTEGAEQVCCAVSHADAAVWVKSARVEQIRVLQSLLSAAEAEGGIILAPYVQKEARLNGILLIYGHRRPILFPDAVRTRAVEDIRQAVAYASDLTHFQRVWEELYLCPILVTSEEEAMPARPSFWRYPDVDAYVHRESSRTPFSALSVFSPTAIPTVGVPAALDDETEAALKTADFTCEEVLIGALGSPEQFEANLAGRFYYIPAAYGDPKALRSLRQVALYRSAYTETPGIRYYADILDVTTVKRHTIPVKLRRGNGDEDYILFSLGAWRRLDRPIDIRTATVKKPRYTNRFLLLHSQSAYELFHIRAPWEFRLSRELRHMASAREGDYVFALGDACAVTMKDGALTLLDGGGAARAVYPLSLWKRDPGTVFEEIKTGLLALGREEKRRRYDRLSK